MFPPIANLSNSSAIRARCEWGFVQTLHECRPDLSLSHSGRVGDPQDNVLDKIPFDEFRSSFAKGAGNELWSYRDGSKTPGKFCSAYSSSALALNHFGPFKARPLPVLGSHRFLHLVDFEVPFPTGLIGTAPHLDVLLQSDNGRVAIESKCLEYIKAKTPKELEKTAQRIREKYVGRITDDRQQSPWFAELEELSAEPTRYRHLDAAQLLKHALGLLNGDVDVSTTLFYLYWEPIDASLAPIFESHREEIAKFHERVRDSSVRFEAMSYPELWAQWTGNGDPFLQGHVVALRRRYAIPALAWEGVSFSDEGWTNSGMIDD